MAPYNETVFGLCGYPNENLSLSDRQWTCPECGSHHDRDVNAAINILRDARGPSVEQMSDVSSETRTATKHKFPLPLGSGGLNN